MSLSGGGAAKLGAQYEAHWTVLCFSEILRREADSIFIEPVGELGVGIEFVLTRSGVNEYHQVKRQQSKGAGWTINLLNREGVLNSIKNRLLSDPDSEFVLVSSDSARSLSELAERARKAKDWNGYSSTFLASNEHRSNFTRLGQYWNLSEDATFDLIRRVKFRTLDPDSLLKKTRHSIGYFVSDAENAVDVLADLIPQEIYQEIDHNSIWGHLKARGFSESRWLTHDVTSLIEEATAQYISSFTGEMTIGTHYIDRHETNDVLAALFEQGSTQCVVVTGEAGSGKSGVLLGVANKAKKSGHTVLALRVDRLDSPKTASELGTQFRLPGSPAYVLSSIATDDTPAVLIIDQVDAVSYYSGRNTELFDPIARVIEQARDNPNIRVLLGCRKFDLLHDRRLKALTSDSHLAAREISIGRLSVEEAKEILDSLGFVTRSIPDSRMELARLPLNLSLIVEMSEDPIAQRLEFQNTNDLFSRFWDYKRNRIESRLERAVPFKEILAALVTYMSERQQLSAPRDVLDVFNSRDVDALVSEHVLVRDHQNYAFFHESFFDYAFARTFVADRGDLVRLLQTEGQDLFRRAQVRQVLYYLRGTNRDLYLETLHQLLSSPAIRAHIKQVVFAVLADIYAPTLDEWVIIEPIITDFSNSPSTWGLVKDWFTSASWFRLLDSNGVIASWMASPCEDKKAAAVTMLHRVRKEEADRVAALMSSYFDASEEWNIALLFLLRGADLGQSRQLFELFLKAADAGILDRQELNSGWGSSLFWDHVEDLLQQNPSWAVEAMALYVPQLLSNTSSVTFSLSTTHVEDVAKKCLTDAARKVPIEIASLLFPIVVRELSLIEEQGDDGQIIEIDLRSWFLERTPNNSTIAETILRVYCLALEHHPSTASHLLSAHLERLQNFGSLPAIAVVTEVHKSHPELSANSGAFYFLSHLPRIAEDISISGHWFFVPFLRTLFPYCSPELQWSVESALMEYHAKHEFDRVFYVREETDFPIRKPDGPKPFGLPQYILLSAIGPSLLSSRGTERFLELERKFGPAELTRPVKPYTGSVSSPIPEHAFTVMKTEHFESAVSKYYGEERAAFRNAISTSTTNHPEAMIDLFAGMRTNLAGQIALDIVQGMRNVQVSLEFALRVLAILDTLPFEQQAKPVIELIQHHGDLDWPESVADTLATLASFDYPEQDLPDVQNQGSSDPRHRITNVDFAEANLTKAQLLRTAATLIFSDSNRARWFGELAKEGISAPEPGVRAGALELLTAWLLFDRDHAVLLFNTHLTIDDELLTSRNLFRFVRYAAITHFGELSETVVELIESQQSVARWNGSRLLSLAAVRHEDTSLTTELLPGEEFEHRLALAEVFAANAAHVQECQPCSSLLSELWNDRSEIVREAASGFFMNWDPSGFALDDLLMRFIDSAAFYNNSRQLFHGLEDAPRVPASTLDAIELFLDSAQDKVGDITQSEAAVVSHLFSSLLKVYASARDPITKDRCMEVIDALAARNAMFFENEIAIFDR